MNEDITKEILSAMEEAAENRESQLASDLNDDSVLLESGLDSLGYAIVVSLLEEKLGYDPFVTMDEPVYPSTLKEFVEIYSDHRKSEE